MKTKVAIVYDRVNKWGGAERVLLALHEIFPDAPLYTSVYDKKKAPWAKAFPIIKTSFLQKFPLANRYHEFLGTFMPLAFESFDLAEFGLVISVTSEAAKGINVGPNTLHICYCLTPTRYLWSHHDLYFKNPVLKFLSRPSVWYLKKWDRKAAEKPDIMVAISSEIRSRIKKYYHRNSSIVFPPVNTSLMYINEVGKHKKYYLMVSRLDYGYKKVELAIEAFNRLGKTLIIVGTGREEKRLKRSAKDNIKFVGRVSEKVLKKYYQNAKALIMPQIEDFGIVAVEAQSYGVPVIAYNKGGSVDTVIPGETGIFFSKQSPDSLTNAVKRFEKMKLNKRHILINAKRFSKERFKKELLALIKRQKKLYFINGD